MQMQAPFVVVANLLGDPARALMINAMMDGRAHAASDLAQAAGISRQTASAHFARLLDGGLVRVEAEGRQRRYRLANAQVAEAIEALTVIAAEAPGARPPARHILAGARTCYDHLAGRLGVAIARVLVARGMLVRAHEGFELAAHGKRFLGERIGVDVETALSARRAFARACLDWTEREPHLAGALGAAVARRCFDAGWVRQKPHSRALLITNAGRTVFKREFGLGEIA